MIWLPVVWNYADIDVYASIIAYASLLNHRGHQAQTYIPLAPNYSTPTSLRLQEFERKNFILEPSDAVIILDTSEPEAIHKFTSDEQILEIIDHHPGYEKYWQGRLGDRVVIEEIGAVATIIYERWNEWDQNEIPVSIAKLLLAAILDNTLNFNAKITTERDHEAAQGLAKIIQTTVGEIAEWYFSEVSETIMSNLRRSLLEDCKSVDFTPERSKIAFGQLAIWDATDVLEKSMDLAKIMSAKNSNWIVSVICISERKNYIFTSSEKYDNYFSKLLKLTCANDWLVSDQLYLRKEIIKKMQS